MAVKAMKICIILIVTFSLIAWVKDDFDFGPIVKVLPLCSGRAPSFWYDLVGGSSLVLLCLWGLRRLITRWRGETDRPQRTGPMARDHEQKREDDEDNTRKRLGNQTIHPKVFHK